MYKLRQASEALADGVSENQRVSSGPHPLPPMIFPAMHAPGANIMGGPHRFPRETIPQVDDSSSRLRSHFVDKSLAVSNLLSFCCGNTSINYSTKPVALESWLWNPVSGVMTLVQSTAAYVFNALPHEIIGNYY